MFLKMIKITQDLKRRFENPKFCLHEIQEQLTLFVNEIHIKKYPLVHPEVFDWNIHCEAKCLRDA